jgi:hypothetical protein
MPGRAPDRTRMRSRPGPHDRRSVRPRREGGYGAPLAGAPGWYVHRKPRRAVLLDRLLPRRRRFGVLATAGLAGVAALAVLLSLLLPYWGEAGTDRSPASSTPRVASSPGAGPHEPTAASAEAPPVSPVPAQVPGGAASRGQQNGSPTAATPTTADPSPPQDMATAPPIPPTGSVALTPQVQSRLRPLPAPVQPESPVGSSARVQLPEPAAPQSPPSSPQRAVSSGIPAGTSSPQGAGETSPAADLPANAAATPTPEVTGDGPSSSRDPSAQPAPTAMAQPTGEAARSSDAAAEPAAGRVQGNASASADRAAPPPDEIRIFIHHTADREGDAALAQRLAEHLRGQGFAVADIRPVDFSIGKASVRYFFEDDRSASEQVVAELGRVLEDAGARAPDQASDFTHFTPKPRPGNVEVWLPAS